jgi:pimeloyl-ACP methyl ester carboxylesterase
MITFVLPGGSPQNRPWLNETAKILEVPGVIRPIIWDHWEDSDQKFIPEEKASLIDKVARGEEINIVAKSIGTLVAALMINKIPYQIYKLILCGIPLQDLNEDEKDTIKGALASLAPEKILCFQNESDPHASYAEVSEFLPVGVKVISKPRSDHEYPYFEDFNEFLKA